MQYVDSFSSRQLFDLVKSIGECRSKYEEDNIIINESGVLQTKMLEHSLSSSKLREYMIRAIYIEMLGHDASFAYIHAIKMTNDKNSLIKRIGYLACCIFLNKNHEFLVLLINTLQRDLSSRNQLDIAAALSSLPYLLNNEILSSIEKSLINLLSHQSPAIRRKAYLVLLKVLSLRPSIIEENPNILRRGLCDVDISVVNSTLYLIDYLSLSDPKICIPLIPYLVATLKQILENNIPKEYEYHLVPAPWTQINIMEVLSKIASYEKTAGEQVYEIILNAIKKVKLSISIPSYNGKSITIASLNSNNKITNNTNNISYAILESCVKAATSIYPNKNLLDQLAETISKFLNSEINYLKYIGIKCLSRIAAIEPSYAIPHQIVVVDCLEEKDETLRRCTLELLCKMSNPQNIEVVVSKLISQLKDTRDQHFQEELVWNIFNLSEKFAPTYNWYLRTMVDLFELSGEIIGINKANNIAQIIAEGPTGDESSDFNFRIEATNLFSKILKERIDNLPEIVRNLSIWVIGEYGSCMSNNQSNIGIGTLQTIYQATLLLFDVFMRLKNEVYICSNNLNFKTQFSNSLSNKKTNTSWETISMIIFSIMKCYSHTIMICSKINVETDLICQDEIKDKQKLFFEEMNDVYNKLINECRKYPCNLIYQKNKEFLSLIRLNNKLDNISESFTNKNYIKFLSNVLPYDASCEEIYVDKNLTFLDELVVEYKLSENYQKKIKKKSESFDPEIKNFKSKNLKEELIEVFEKNKKNLLEINSESECSTHQFNEDPSLDGNSLNNTTNICNSITSFGSDSANIIKDDFKCLNKTSLTNKKFFDGEIIQSSKINYHSNKRTWGPGGYLKDRKIERNGEKSLKSSDNIESVKPYHEKDLQDFLNKQKKAMALFSGISPENRTSKNKFT